MLLGILNIESIYSLKIQQLYRFTIGYYINCIYIKILPLMVSQFSLKYNEFLKMFSIKFNI